MSLLLWTSVSVAAMTSAASPLSFEAALFAGQPPLVERTPVQDGSAVESVASAPQSGPEIVPPPLVRTLPAADAAGDPAGSGDIVVTGERRGIAPDPLRAVNESTFKATQAVDNAITGPAARAYKRTLPRAVRGGIHNFLYNFREPVVFVNFLLQHKIGKAAETFARFAINTTAGVAGIFDVAKKKPFRLPRRSNGFANTLGFYGVPNGPFLFLPITGPTTVRDLFGGAIDRLILPFTYGSRITKPEFVVPFATLSVLDHRSEFDDTLKQLHDKAKDPYANTRTFYLQRRQAEIDALKRGQPLVGGMSEPPPNGVDERGRPRPMASPADAPAPEKDAPASDTVPAPAAPSPAPTAAAVPMSDPATSNGPSVSAPPRMLVPAG